MSLHSLLPEQPGNGFEFYRIEEPEEPVLLPFFDSYIQAGFPSPADDYTELSLDLLKELVDKPQSTFLVRVQGNSMEGATIIDGSLLVVDRSLPVRNGCAIIAEVDGEYTVKTFRKDKNGDIWLVPEHAAYEPVKITPEMHFRVWGVVKYVINEPRTRN